MQADVQRPVEVTVTILHNNNFFVPNGFSPNNDGYNDYLFVRETIYMEYVSTVFDRCGWKSMGDSESNWRMGWKI